MAFFELWNHLKEREATPKRGEQPKLKPAQLSRLLTDCHVREALKDEDVASLLPPVGKEVFRRFTADSAQLQQVGADEQQRAADSPSKPNARLKEGESLPFFYGDPPTELLHTPLEELDPFYQSQKTFLVLSRGNILHRFNADSSCYLLSPFNRLRTTAIKILLNRWFQWFILMILLMNCVVMTIENPMLKLIMECVFTAVYTFEVALKVSSRGFALGSFTFIRDPWNWLDLFIISTAYPAHFVDFGKLSVLVTLPRVLKIFSVCPGLRKRVEALIRSGRSFVHILIITAFCLCVLASIATQLFTGDLRQKCVLWPKELSSGNFTNTCYDSATGSCDDNPRNDSYFDYHAHVLNAANHYHHSGHLDPLLCGNSSSAGGCPQGYLCLRMGRNPNYGYTSYDNFGWSLLSMFRLLTQDYWENLLEMTMRSAGGLALPVFVLLFLPSCFMLLSLLLAVVVTVTVDREKTEAAERTRTKEEHRRIEEVLKRKQEEEEEQASNGATAAGKQGHEEEGVTVTVADEDGPHLSCWQRFRLRLRPLVLNRLFDLVIVISLIVNIILMATEHYPMSEQFEEALVTSELVFVGIYVVEMLVRMLALGIRGYFQVRWHIFDFILVLLSVVDLFTDIIMDLSLLRLFRILRLARWWPALHLFLRIVWSAVQSLTLRVLLVLVFLWVVVGMQLFRTDYEANVCAIAADCQPPRWHMQDLFHAFMLVFRALCGGWIETMWDCMEVSHPAVCGLYFSTLVVFGRLLVVTLFLELLLSSTTNYELANLEETSDNQTFPKKTWTWRRLCWWTRHKTDGDPAHRVSQNQKESMSLTAVTSEADLKAEHKTQPKTSEENQEEDTAEDCCCHCCYRCSPVQDKNLAQDSGGVWTKSRRVCVLIVQSRVFEGFMVFVILLSCAALVFEDVSLLQHPVLLQVLDWADLVFNLIFLLEMILKWMCFGFKNYFSNFSCWLDFLVLDASIFALILQSMGVSCRPLRVLRTLRTLSRFQNLKVVLLGLLVTLPYLLQGLLVVLTVWLFFGVMGVKLFAGKFYYCFNDTSEEMFLPDDVANKTMCFEMMMESFEVRWKNNDFHFDNVGMSYVSLLLTAASGGWTGHTYPAVDSVRIEDQPVYENDVYKFPYFVCFIVVGCFFCFLFFIRVFLRGIQRHRHQMRGKHLFITKEQQIDSEGFKERFTAKPGNPFPPPQNACLARLFALVTSRRFEIFMLTVACLNVFVLGMDAYDHSEEASAILHWFYFSFLSVFLLEFFLKIVALRRFYFSSALNVIDFIVLLCACVELFMADLVATYMYVTWLLALRLARFGRVLRFCRHTRGIRTLLLGFLMSLPALINIGLLLLVLVFTFSAVGMFNFGYVQEVGALNDLLSFRTFWSSLATMTTVSTTSAWDGRLVPLMKRPPDCDPNKENPGSSFTGDCGNPAAGVAFFASYICLFILLVVHLFIAVILEAFNAREPKSSGRPEALGDEHLQMFYKTWKRFDPEASQVIHYSRLSEFCDALQDPLRVPKPNDIKLINMDLPLLSGDRIRCLDVLQALTAEMTGDPGPLDSLRARLEEKFKNPSKASDEPISSTLQRKHEEAAAGVIQRAFRKHKGGSGQNVGGASET